MKSNRNIKSLLFLFFALFCLGIGKAAERPNIVFIFADDWGWGDLSCHGHPYVKTPNIDRLAKEGTDFHRFTVASGVCSPSRTAVITGHFPARYNIDGHFAWVSSNARRARLRQKISLKQHFLVAFWSIFEIGRHRSPKRNAIKQLFFRCFFYFGNSQPTARSEL